MFAGTIMKTMKEEENMYFSLQAPVFSLPYWSIGMMIYLFPNPSLSSYSFPFSQ